MSFSTAAAFGSEVSAPKLVRYNFALVPVDGGPEFIALSQERCAAYSPEYILNGTDSLAHLSVCQIETDRPLSELQAILRQVLEKGDMTATTTFEAVVKVKPGFGDFEHVNWIEVVPDAESAGPLHLIHAHVREAVLAAGFSCKNKNGAEYQPHATLGNAAKATSVDRDVPLPEKITANFKLVLGIADAKWQFNKVLPLGIETAPALSL